MKRCPSYVHSLEGSALRIERNSYKLCHFRTQEKDSYASHSGIGDVYNSCFVSLMPLEIRCNLLKIDSLLFKRYPFSAFSNSKQRPVQKDLFSARLNCKERKLYLSLLQLSVVLQRALKKMLSMISGTQGSIQKDTNPNKASFFSGKSIKNRHTIRLLPQG